MKFGRDFVPPQRVQIIIKNMFILMAYFLIVTIFLAIAYYPEKYQFFSENISNLGAFLSRLLFDNTTSMIIFIVGFGICGAMCLGVAVLYFVHRDLHGWYVKGPLAIVLAFGAAGVAIPKDHSFSILHTAGAAMFIGGFAAFNAYLQITSSYRKHIKKEIDVSRADTIWDIVLSIFVLIILFGYFTIFALDWLGVGAAFLGPVFQKVTVFAEILALYFIDNKDI